MGQREREREREKVETEKKSHVRLCIRERFKGAGAGSEKERETFLPQLVLPYSSTISEQVLLPFFCLSTAHSTSCSFIDTSVRKKEKERKKERKKESLQLDSFTPGNSCSYEDNLSACVSFSSAPSPSSFKPREREREETRKKN